jgi:hypothetical protein
VSNAGTAVLTLIAVLMAYIRGWIRARRGSIWASSLAHAATNLVDGFSLKLQGRYSLAKEETERQAKEFRSRNNWKSTRAPRHVAQVLDLHLRHRGAGSGGVRLSRSRTALRSPL